MSPRGASALVAYSGCTAPMSGRSSHSRHSSTSCWLARVAASHAWARGGAMAPLQALVQPARHHAVLEVGVEHDTASTRTQRLSRSF